jgi:hypothetical protein
MPQPIESIKKLFDDYHRFDDGYIVSFEYFYSPEEKLVAKLVLEARNHRADGNVWRRVAVTMNDVKELHAEVLGDRLRRICCSVKLLNFGDLWCVDIDGAFTDPDDPSTLEEVREMGIFYLIGLDIEAYEIANTYSEQEQP